jgi:hypothetical protein
MMDPRVLVLVAGCVLFGGIIAVELQTGGSDAAPAATPSVAGGAAPASRSARPTPVDDLLAASLARPLFSPNRRPPDTGQRGASSAPELTDKRLSGIVIDADRRLAIFAVSGTKPLTVSEGDSVNGWRVENIAAAEVALVSPSGTQTLKPKPDSNAVRQTRPAPQASGEEAVARPDPRTRTAPARAGGPPGPTPASPRQSAAPASRAPAALRERGD